LFFPVGYRIGARPLAEAPFDDVPRRRTTGTAGATPPGDEIVQAPVIARRRSDRCEGPALLRSQHDAEKLVEPSPSVGDLFHFKPACNVACWHFSDVAAALAKVCC
jgi:hypothetical protein